MIVVLCLEYSPLAEKIIIPLLQHHFVAHQPCVGLSGYNLGPSGGVILRSRHFSHKLTHVAVHQTVLSRTLKCGTRGGDVERSRHHCTNLTHVAVTGLASNKSCGSAWCWTECSRNEKTKNSD